MMKKALCIILSLCMAAVCAGCARPSDANADTPSRDTLYQVSLLQGLTLGDYYGSITVAQLKQYGDTGIGTFDALDGELIMVDGVVYRAAGDGSVEVVPDDETIPFSNVSFLDADQTLTLGEIPDYSALCDELNALVEERGKNRFYMIRIDGTFRQVNVRSEYAQQEPYRPLVDVLKTDQTFFDYEDIEGTVVGLYCPPYMSDINAVGWHLHFISEDRSCGGHVLGLHVAEATLTWDDTDAFHMVLPQNEMFDSFDLTVDQSEDIEDVETGARD